MNRSDEDAEIESMLRVDGERPLTAAEVESVRLDALDKAQRMERGIPEIKRPRGGFGIGTFLAVVGAIVIGGLFLVRKPSVVSRAMTAVDTTVPDGQRANTAAVSPPPSPFVVTPEVPVPVAGAKDGTALVPVMPAPVADQSAALEQERQRRLQERAQREQEARDLAKRRLQSAMLVSGGGDFSTAAASSADVTAESPVSKSAPVVSADGNTAFLQSEGNSQADTERSSLLRNQSTLVAQGTLVAGVLETAINSDLPGLLRAVVAVDVYSFDNSRVMIPRGTRLIGQYRSGVAIGQTRAFIAWNRLITPQGVSILLGSPGTDELGAAGVTGKVDEHFFKRFGAALMVSVVNGGIQAGSNAATGGGGGNDIIIQSAADSSKIIEGILQQRVNIPPTIRVAQGTPIRIFINKDLDFSPTNKLASAK
jgi:type IV secretory pathway VirB10-like protein